jgi:hypothetical protein
MDLVSMSNPVQLMPRLFAPRSAGRRMMFQRARFARNLAPAGKTRQNPFERAHIGAKPATVRFWR